MNHSAEKEAESCWVGDLQSCRGRQRKVQLGDGWALVAKGCHSLLRSSSCILQTHGSFWVFFLKWAVMIKYFKRKEEGNIGCRSKKE